MKASIIDFYDWRPSFQQELLLKAALLKGEDSWRAWEEWSGAVDLSQLDNGSQRLLPLLYHNLKVQGIDHPYSGHFKKSYIDTWAQNQILFAKITPLLLSFREAGISILVFKGASLTIRYYRDFGLRPMSDFDFLIPTRQAMPAIELLRQMDWIPQLKNPDKSLAVFLSVNHALHFSNLPRGNLDLHWHLLSECLAPDADQDFWTGALPIEVNGVPSLCLNPADDLFHICIHGLRWNKMPPIRWIADAVTILTNGEAINWERLVEQARRQRLSLPLKEALTYIKDHFSASIPAEALDALDRIPVSNVEIKENKARTSRPGWSWYIPPFLWVYYPRIAHDTARSPGVFGFIQYVQAVWELDHAWQVPFYAAWRNVERLLGMRSE